METTVVVPVLQSLGVAGAIISVLMGVVTVMGGVIAYMYKQANKVYGYRLAERDVLNKTLSDATVTYAALVKGLEERNEINEDQSELIAQQSMAFELLKVTVLSQFEHIKDSAAATAIVVASISESQRTLNSMLVDNRHAVRNYVDEVKNYIVTANNAIRSDINSGRHQSP